VDTFTIASRAGDLFPALLGRADHNGLEPDHLDLVERHRPDMKRALRALVSEANKGGGEDNITSSRSRSRTRCSPRTATRANRRDRKRRNTLSELDGVRPSTRGVVPVEEIRARGRRAGGALSEGQAPAPAAPARSLAVLLVVVRRSE